MQLIHVIKYLWENTCYTNTLFFLKVSPTNFSIHQWALPVTTTIVVQRTLFSSVYTDVTAN